MKTSLDGQQREQGEAVTSLVPLFGVALFVIPCGYVILEDLRRLTGGSPRERPRESDQEHVRQAPDPIAAPSATL